MSILDVIVDIDTFDRRDVIDDILRRKSTAVTTQIHNDQGVPV